jgi:hypothetical protein
MNREWLITILDQKRKSSGKEKRPVIPSKRKRFLPRRISNPIITFYDLGQVNNNASLDDAPVWSDHPILKTPVYTIQANKWGGPVIGTPMSEVEYQVDPFTDDDFQAYTDMMFNYPVEEWNQRYRQITIPDDDH